MANRKQSSTNFSDRAGKASDFTGIGKEAPSPMQQNIVATIRDLADQFLAQPVNPAAAASASRESADFSEINDLLATAEGEYSRTLSKDIGGDGVDAAVVIGVINGLVTRARTIARAHVTPGIIGHVDVDTGQTGSGAAGGIG